MRKYLMLAACVALSACSSFDWPEIRSLVKVGDERAVSGPELALAQGREHFAQANYGIAVDSFNAAVNLDPRSIRALNGLAASYDNLGRFDLAQRYYSTALALDPKSAVTLNNAGYSQLLQGNVEEAQKMFEVAAKIDPENARITANIELAVNMLGYDTRRAVREQVAVVELSEVAAPTMWIEKTAERVHTLVTRPDPEFLEHAARLQVDPRIVSLGGALQR
ncbi:MAG: tetratricopeptide repeat protein [Alphaproteobacteria bacterium]|nr:tetratricopeptide repeat protein [Alphaproteobacteria bacterium]